ncbi:hypothetical protein [Paraburkholderia solisilvae]|uniref:Uncharacterized protein n=1 Tax=Paraburkholderia solisilvae TaxID=624376 RepID=A0A6J5DU33_9BURK|nr:hypothetical protein [Paraburkholderia solisilvae]CAB3757107.1 hypothetical protein LMG29739_02612 [Paraburkholderia solisilvae]
MPGLASFLRLVFRSRAALDPLEHRASGDSAPPTAASQAADTRAERAALDDWNRRTDPERQERIAAYARAGYFNLGYTYEMFHLVAQFPPE